MATLATDDEYEYTTKSTYRSDLAATATFDIGLPDTSLVTQGSDPANKNMKVSTQYTFVKFYFNGKNNAPHTQLPYMQHSASQVTQVTLKQSESK